MMMRVVCTGKGMHREVPMPKFDDWPSGDWRELKPVSGEPFFRIPLRGAYTFTCRRCTPMRETRMKRKTLREALDGLRAAGQATLDISRLPF
jgi:hypothetical protein